MDFAQFHLIVVTILKFYLLIWSLFCNNKKKKKTQIELLETKLHFPFFNLDLAVQKER